MFRLGTRTMFQSARPVAQLNLRRYSRVSANTVYVGDTPFKHTSSTWLSDNAAQCNARRITFNLQQLHNRVAQFCHGSRITASWKQDGEHSHRFVHFLADDGKRFVAKIPLPAAGASGLTMHSEVATIEYVRKHGQVPAPKVLEWNESTNNDVGCAYMIMEHAPGVCLARLWEHLKTSEKQSCLESIAKHLARLADMQFDAYGSLYFSHGSKHFDSSHQHPTTDSRFCIGPYAASHALDHVVQPTTAKTYGPCLDLVSFAHARVQAGLDGIPDDGFTRPCDRLFQGTREQHIKAVEVARTVLDHLARDARVLRVGAPVLTSPALNLKSIFVDAQDPTIVTAMLSWRPVSIKPLFTYYRQPLVDMIGPSLTEDGDLVFAENIDLGRSLVPSALADLHDLDHDLIALFDSCHASWQNGLPYITDRLISIAESWSDLDLPSPCPYSLPCGHHLELHQQRAKALDDYLELAYAMGLSPDESVSHESLPHVLASLKAALVSDSFVSAMPNARVESLWPFGDVDLAAQRSQLV